MSRPRPVLFTFGLVALVSTRLLSACPEPTPPLDLGDVRHVGESEGFQLRTPWRTPGAQAIALDPLVDGLAPIIADINRALRLPRTIPIEFIACGEPNAFYSPVEPRIVMCDELIAVLGQQLGAQHPNDAEFGTVLLGAVAFTLLHEMSHAVYAELKIPNVGNNESAADSMAAVLLLQNGGALAAASGADAFMAMAAWKERSGLPLRFWDEHAFDLQRFYDVACLVYGSDPARFGYLLADQTLPWDRAKVCPTRFEDNSRSVTAQLAAFRR